MRILLVARSPRGDPRLLYQRIIDCQPSADEFALICTHVSGEQTLGRLRSYPDAGSILASYLHAQNPPTLPDDGEGASDILERYAPDVDWKLCRPPAPDGARAPSNDDCYDYVLFANRIQLQDSIIESEMRHLADFVAAVARGKEDSSLATNTTNLKDFAIRFQALQPLAASLIAMHLPQRRPNLAAEPDIRYCIADPRDPEDVSKIVRLANLTDATRTLENQLRFVGESLPARKQVVFRSLLAKLDSIHERAYTAAMYRDDRTTQAVHSPAEQPTTRNGRPRPRLIAKKRH